MTIRHIIAATICLGLCSCNRERIETQRVAKPQSRGMALPSTPAELKWQVPENWRSMPYDGPLRRELYQFTTAGGQTITTSITPLLGTAGGDLANVNRWRRQVQLPPIQEPELEEMSRWMTSPLGKIRLIEVAGLPGDNVSKDQIYAAILPHRRQTWFIKLKGPRTAFGKGEWQMLKNFVNTFEEDQ